MKRFSLKFVTALFILAAVAAPVSVLAQTTPSNGTGSANTSGTLSTVGDYVAGVTIGVPLKIIDGVIELAILPIAGFIFWITGQMLDYAVQYSLGIAQHVSDASSAIVLGWTIIRDIFNMMFIFSIIWISIETMLGIGSWHGKQVLKGVILAAIFINFSFFLTEILIDAGNIFGAWFYNGILVTLGAVNGAAGATGTCGTTATGVVASCSTSLSAGISDAMGVFSMYSSQSSVWGFLSGISLSDITQRLIAAVIRLGIVAFSCYIFAYVAVLFITRTVSLLFSLVTSPIGFAGSVLPGTEEYSKIWWKELRTNILLAPIFLLFLYIIIAFVNTPIFAGATNVAGGTNGSTFDPSQYFKYFLLAGMLWYALRSAKEHAGQLGDTFGKMASQIGNFAAGTITGLATGGLGLAARATVGRAGAVLSDSQWAKNLEGTKRTGITGTLVSKVGKGIRGTGDWAGKQSFDTSGLAEGALAGVNLKTPSWAKAPKGGFVGAQKARTEAEKKEVVQLYTRPEQDLIVNNAKKSWSPQAEMTVANSVDARMNVQLQNDLKNRSKKVDDEIKGYDKGINLAKQTGNVVVQTQIEAAKREAQKVKVAVDEKLKETEKAYKDMVDAEVKSLVGIEAQSNKPLSDALQATERFENYAQKIEKASVVKGIVSATAAGVGGIFAGVPAYKMTKERISKENENLAKLLRKYKETNQATKEKDLAELAKQFAAATAGLGTTPTPPPGARTP